jgi:hypothetical protein
MIGHFHVTYTSLEASGGYAFWTYTGYGVVVALGVICYICLLLAGVSSLRFTFTMTAVNFFTLLVERAHAPAPSDSIAYQEADGVETKIPGDLGIEFTLDPEEALEGRDGFPLG